jgi:hypothetical protein
MQLPSMLQACLLYESIFFLSFFPCYSVYINKKVFLYDLVFLLKEHKKATVISAPLPSIFFFFAHLHLRAATFQKKNGSF